MFRIPVPQRMAGRSLADCEVRQRTGCNVVAVERAGLTVTNPVATDPLPADADLVVIGDAAARQRFLEAYPMDARGRR